MRRLLGSTTQMSGSITTALLFWVISSSKYLDGGRPFNSTGGLFSRHGLAVGKLSRVCRPPLVVAEPPCSLLWGVAPIRSSEVPQLTRCGCPDASTSATCRVMVTVSHEAHRPWLV